MVNSEDFVNRLKKMFNYYGLSPAVFADKTNVQRSSISHLLSGRNKPSLEFVLKIIKRFPEVNLYWLLNGEGEFPSNKTDTPTPISPISFKKEKPITQNRTTEKIIEKIIILYTDGSFQAYKDPPEGS